jgi:hypothetical protein
MYIVYGIITQPFENEIVNIILNRPPSQKKLFYFSSAFKQILLLPQQQPWPARKISKI